jgi:hypothetical protein
MEGGRPATTLVTSGELGKWAEIRQWGAATARNWTGGCLALPAREEAAAVTCRRLPAAAIRRGAPPWWLRLPVCQVRVAGPGRRARGSALAVVSAGGSPRKVWTT